MKIATVTFHRALNYGAILQTYALQKKLIELKIDTEVLDYRSSFIENHYKKKSIMDYMTLKKFMAIFLYNGFSIIKRTQFESFINENIKISKNVYNNDNIADSEAVYDKFLVGSDQVWNYKTAGFDKNYFLNFLKDSKKKNSYAASVGLSDLPDKIKTDYRNLLIDFDKISVREIEGEKLLKNIIKRKDIKTVLDPTMLLNKEEWRKLEKKCDIPPKYVLLYLLCENKEIINFAKKVAKKNNCEIVYINNQLLPKHGIINKRYVTPEGWLYLFDNADYVVTNSFHGTVFSIIYRKIFWTNYLPTSNNVNSRLKTLLGSIGLMNRIISDGCKVENNKINYKDNEKVISEKIEESLNFLKEVGEINE